MDNADPETEFGTELLSIATGTRAGGNHCRSNHHSDKGKGNEQIMHGFSSPLGVLQPLYICIMRCGGKMQHPTNTVTGGIGVVEGIPPKVTPK